MPVERIAVDQVGAFRACSSAPPAGSAAIRPPRSTSKSSHHRPRRPYLDEVESLSSKEFAIDYMSPVRVGSPHPDVTAVLRRLR